MSGAVPQLRFPGFDGEWRETPLSGLIASLDAGVSVNSGDGTASDGSFGVMKTSCVTEGRFDILENKLVDEPTEIARLKEHVRAGTVIISRMNTPQLVGANAYVDRDAANLFLPDRLWAAKMRSDAVPRWIGYLMAHPVTRTAMSDRATGTSGSMKNLSKDAVLSISVNAPEPAEQQKIADCLGTVDAKLDALRRKKSGLETFKSGLMQRLFSQDLRFTRDDGTDFPDWDEMTFDEAVIRPSEKIDPRRTLLGAHVIDLENLESGTGRIFHMGAVEDSASLKNAFKAGDVLFGKLRPYLRKFARPDFDGCCSSEIWVLRGKKVLNEFLFYLVQSPRFIELATISSGSKMPRADWGVISTGEFEIPHPDEQRKIADALSAMDVKIAAVADQITHMETFKKGLLQQMFV